jgi:hypothetical protein
MKQDSTHGAPNVCNNCVKPEKKPDDEISILIKCDSATQKKIEEICINESISFSEYFLRLHVLDTHEEFVLCPKIKASDLRQPIKEIELPEGFGEVNPPEEAPSLDLPKKRGRPFKVS